MVDKTHSNLNISDFTVGDEDINSLLFGVVFRDKYDNKVKRIHLTRDDAIKISSYLLAKCGESNG